MRVVVALVCNACGDKVTELGDGEKRHDARCSGRLEPLVADMITEDEWAKRKEEK